MVASSYSPFDPKVSPHLSTRPYHLPFLMNTPNTISDPPPDAVEVPWLAAYPLPKCTDQPSIPRTEILRLFQDGYKQGKDFVLIDLRRTDHNVTSTQGKIRHVINVLTCHIGGYYPRVHESPSTFPISDDPHAVCHTFCGQN